MNSNYFQVIIIFSVTKLLIANSTDSIKDLTTDEFQVDCLLSHNDFREKHCSSPIKYSPKLKLFATQRASLLAKHNGKGVPNTVFGENIHRFRYENIAKTECKPIVQFWYNKKGNHDWKTDVNPHSQPFAQVIWNSTQRIGCASVVSTGADADGYVYTVCNYYNSDEFPKKSSENVMSIRKCDERLSNRTFSYRVLTNSQWFQECIDEHNKIRKLHSVDPLTINDGIFQLSHKRATEMAQKGFRFFRHKRSELGENIHWSKASHLNASQPLSCNQSIGKWYQELNNYDWSERVNHNGTVRHFIQLVYKETTSLGCSQIRNTGEPKGGVYTVCLYEPKATFDDIDLQWENVFPVFTAMTTVPPMPVAQNISDEAVDEPPDELDDETELEREFKDVDDVIDTHKQVMRQTPALTLEDMFAKSSTTVGYGFDRNEYLNKGKGGSRRRH